MRIAEQKGKLRESPDRSMEMAQWQRVSCKVYRATIKARHAVCIYSPRDPKEPWEVVAEKIQGNSFDS